MLKLNNNSYIIELIQLLLAVIGIFYYMDSNKIAVITIFVIIILLDILNCYYDKDEYKNDYYIWDNDGRT